MNKSALLIILLVGLGVSVYASNSLYAWKADLVPYTTRVPVQFYAGMDKFLSNVSWMTLVQWEAEASEGGMTSEKCDRLYQRLNTLTNLDPLFIDAYIDGALTLAPQRPDYAVDLLEKAMKMGAKGWKAPLNAGQICQRMTKDYPKAVQYMEMANADPDAPSYVLTSLLTARCDAADNDPMTSINIWYTELSKRPTDAELRKSGAARIEEWSDEALKSYDQKLKDATDPASRQRLLDDRAKVIKISQEFKNVSPTTAPTTQSSAGL
jgi:hypothetical protein